MVWRAIFASTLSTSLPSALVPLVTARLRHYPLVFASRRKSSAVAEGWSYEQVDVSTGRTPLDVLYEERLERIREIFESPLPPLPKDGNVDPDFLVGFAHYEYRLRDQYRAVLAKALGVSVAAVRLSVAWSGRFDVTRFNRVQKVCGVRVLVVDRQLTEEEMQEKIGRLVRAINERRSEALLAAHIVQASEAIPEVEFAAGERDAIVAERLHRWIRQHILSPHLVVFLYGANDTSSHGTAQRNWDANRQRAFIEERCVKAFSHRRVVPHILSFSRLTDMLREAVQKGEVEGIGPLVRNCHADEAKGGNNNSDNVASNDGGWEKKKEEEEEARKASSGDAASAAQGDGSLKTLLSLDDEAAWHNLIRRALFQRRDNRAVFPLFFIHGECAGGVEEMRYLLHNREAFDAVLLHPNDVAFKKKFMSRFRSSHSRLCMANEMSA